MEEDIMKIKNLTNKQQAVTVRDLTGDRREYVVYLTPYGATDIDLVNILHPERYAGILEINGIAVKRAGEVEEIDTPEEPKSKEVEEINTLKSLIEESKKVEESTPEISKDTFVCDICGAEFASARGLNAHKNKAHSE